MFATIRKAGFVAAVAAAIGSTAFAATQTEAEAAIRASTNLSATLAELAPTTTDADLAGALANAGIPPADVVAALRAAGIAEARISTLASSYVAQLPVAQQAAAISALQAVGVTVAIVVAPGGAPSTTTTTTTPFASGSTAGSGGGGSPT